MVRLHKLTITKLLLIAVCVPIGLGAAGFGIVQTRWAKEIITQKVNSLDLGALELKVQDLHGLLPFHIQVGDIVCADPKGAFVHLSQAEVRISPWQLFTGTVAIDLLRVRKLTVSRPPQLPPAPASAGTSSPPSLPLGLSLHLASLQIPALHLGPALLGQKADLSLSAQGAWNSAQDLALSLKVHQTGSSGLSLSTRAEVQGDSPSLRLQLRFQDQPDGIVLHRLNLPVTAPVRLALQGQGPLQDWQGKLRLDMGETELAASSLHFRRLPDSLDVETTARLRPGPLLPPELTALLPGRHDLDLELRAGAERDFSKVRIHSLRLHSPLGDVNLHGEAGLQTREFQVAGSVQVPDLKPFAPLVHTGLTGAAGVSLHANGTMQAPKVRLTATARHLDVMDWTAQHAELSISTTPDSAGMSVHTRLPLAGHIAVNALAHSGRPLFPGPLTGDFQALLFPKAQRGELESLHLTLPGTAADLRGRAAATGPFQARLDLRTDGLHRFPALKNLPLSCALGLKSRARGNWKTADVNATLEASVSDVHGLPPALAQVAGKAGSVRTAVSVQGGRTVALEHTRITAGELDFQTRAHVDLQTKDVAGNWTLHGPRLSAIPAAASMGVSGFIDASGSMRGNMHSLAQSVRVEINDFSGPNLNPSQVRCTFNGQVAPAEPAVSGDLGIGLRRGKTRIQTKTSLTYAHNLLQLRDMTLQAPHTTLHGGLKLDTGSGSVQANTRLDASSIAWLETFTSLPARGRLVLQASAGGSVASMHLSAHGRAQNLRLAGASMHDLDVTTELRDIQTLDGDLHVAMSNATAAGMEITRADLRATGNTGRAAVNISISGQHQEPFELDVAGHVRRSGSSWHLLLPSGNGTYARMPFTWSDTLRVDMGPKGTHLDCPLLHVARGTLSCTADMHGQAVNGRFKAAGIDLARLPLPAQYACSGRAAMQGELSGSTSSPRASVHLRLANLRSELEAGQDVPPLQAALSGSLDRSGVQAQISVDGGRAITVQADLALPGHIALSPERTSLAGTVQGRVTADADLGVLAATLPVDGQDLSGALTCDLNLSGPLNGPAVHGRLSLTNGTYENYSSGTVLTKLAGGLVFNGHTATLTGFQATDGEQGRIRIGGDLRFPSFRALTYGLDLHLDQATLMRLDMATATLSGDLQVNGTSSGAGITGRLKAFPVNIGLPDPSPPGLDGLHIVYPQQQGREAARTQQRTSPSFAAKTTLDLDIELPGGCFVRGRGLDSEWKGELAVKGPATAPRISGYMAVVRGRLDFLTKRFTLEKGRITFLSQFPPEPELDITASSKINDLSTTITISGPATQPAFELGSDPALPRDEILARILFNRDLNQINPVQAVKLALAVRTLTSGGNGGFMGKIRQSFGLDELSIDTNATAGEGSNVTVGAGKYLNENIYFKVMKGLENDSGHVLVNIQLTPHISVQTNAGSAHQGMHIEWSYRY